MTTRRHAPISALLALVLLCLMPAALSARPRIVSHRPKTHSLPVREHSRKAIAEKRDSGHRSAPLVPEQHATGRHTRRGAETVNLRRDHLRHSAKPRSPQLARSIQPRRTSHDPLAIAAASAPAEAATGISHPPDLNDVDLVAAAPVSATVPVPVVSVIRKTSEKPQLPTIEEAAATPEILPSLYNKRGRLIVPPALRGSHEILLHQNEVADREGLDRVQDDNDLETMRHRSMLVALPVSGGMQVDERLPVNRRYCRPWTAQFLATLARAHYARFHTPLQINSAVRTVEFQQRLIRTNGNAAPAGGETASPHLTGQAVDLAKHGLSLSEIAWMRGYLLPLIQEGKIDVEEEFQQSCFHISVYKKYLPPSAAPPRSIASTHRDRPAALALAIH